MTRVKPCSAADARALTGYAAAYLDPAHYGVAGIGRDAQVRAIRAVEALVAVAREVTS